MYLFKSQWGSWIRQFVQKIFQPNFFALQLHILFVPSHWNYDGFQQIITNSIANLPQFSKMIVDFHIVRNSIHRKYNLGINLLKAVQYP